MSYIKNWKNFIQESDLEVINFDPQGELNPNIWVAGEPDREVADVLMQIAIDFYDSLEIAENFQDIRITGSNAGYFWTDLSDIDLHIIVNFANFGENRDLVKDLLNLKRAQWNIKHKIMIRGHEVEIYIQDENEPHYSMGEYSLLRREWIQRPERTAKSIDYRLVGVKSDAIADEIDALERMFKDGDYKEAYRHANLLKSKIKKMRHAGLSSNGVFSLENLAFKTLRSNNYIEKLFSLLNLSYDKKMSITQQ